MNYRYKAFISYSHADEAMARWLHRSLESYRPPPQLGITSRLRPVFRDREELAASTDLSEEIMAALRASESLVVICSRSAAASHWVNEEVRLFQSLAQGKRVFCLLVDGTPNGAEDECLPPILRRNDGHEPLAADLRRSADGKRGALLKLAAGLLGVRYDDLRQRDLLARQRRLALVAASSFGAMLLAVGLAWFAWQSRQEAVAARTEAETQRQLAQQESLVANQTTEFLVELFDVSDPSEARGNAITAREILDRGMEDIQSAEDLQPSVRGRLLLTIGRVYQELGLYAPANTALETSLTIHRGLGVEDPALLAEALTEVGTLQSEQGDFEASRTSFDEALSIRRGLLQAPHADIVASMAAVANTHWRQDQLDEAERLADEAQRMLDALPGPDEPLRHVVRNLRANVYSYQGRYELAEPLLYELLEYSYREHGELYPGTGFAHDNLAITLTSLERWEEAETHYRKSLAILEHVYGPEHPEVAQTMANLADFLLQRERLDESEALLTGAIERFSETHGREYFMVADSLAGLADIARVRGHYTQAMRHIDECLAIYGATLPEQHAKTQYAQLLRADILIEEGAFDEAQAYLVTMAAGIDQADYPEHVQEIDELLKELADRRADLKE